MAGTIADIGVPGQPLDTPPLTEWQAAVRDALTPLTPTLGNITPAAGWADYAGSYAGMYVTKVGRICVAEAMLKPTTDTSSSGLLTIATVPTLFFPARYTVGAAVVSNSANAPLIGRIYINTAGAIVVSSESAGPITAAAGWVAFTLAYRSAT